MLINSYYPKICIVCMCGLMYYFFRNYISGISMVMHNMGNDMLFLRASTYFAGAYSLSQILAGYLLDKFKGKILGICCIILSVTFFLLTYLPMQYFPYIFGLIGSNLSILVISITFFVSKIVKATKIGMVTSFIKFSMIMSASLIFFSLSINTLDDIRRIQFVLSILVLILGCIMLIISTISNRKSKIKKEEFINIVEDEDIDKPNIRIQNSELAYIALLSACIVVPFYFFNISGFQFLPGNPKQSTALMNGCLALGILIFPILSERYGVKMQKIISIPLFLQTIILIIVLIYPCKTTTLLAAVIVGITNGTHLMGFVWISKQRPKNLGTMLGILNFVIMFGGTTILANLIVFLKYKFSFVLAIKFLLGINCTSWIASLFMNKFVKNT